MSIPTCLRLLPIALLAACAAPQAPSGPPGLPLMAWDHQTPQATQRTNTEWTMALLSAIHSVGTPLLGEVPADIGEWCPGYVTGDESQRAAFWAGMFSALAKHESTWNERATGGGGAWIGLVQIAPPTARAYGCEARTAAELKDGAANLACAVRIAAHTVPRDGYVATGREGLAADWGPFTSDRKRSEMVAWVSRQSYCQAGGDAKSGAQAAGSY